MDGSQVAAITDFFRNADDSRRRQGEMLDRLGCGPRTTPSRAVHEGRSARLLAYQELDSARPPILLVPAPIKTSYIWDIAPGASVIRRLLAARVQPYLVEWRRPRPGDETLGLEEYADAALARCVTAIAEETGRTKITLVGHSLGGTLAAIFASLHPGRVASLVALEAPIEFGAGRLEAAVAAAPHASAITAMFGNVPGSFLAWASVNADPATFGIEPWLDLVASAFAPAAHRLHWRVRRWTFDESPMARRLFEEVGEDLYRNNRFAQRTLRVGDPVADPRAIDMPILAVGDPRSRIVPPPSIDAYRTHTGSRDVTILRYAGYRGVMLQHVGVLVGANAHRSLWPRIVNWIGRH